MTERFQNTNYGEDRKQTAFIQWLNTQGGNVDQGHSESWSAGWDAALASLITKTLNQGNASAALARAILEAHAEWQSKYIGIGHL